MVDLDTKSDRKEKLPRWLQLLIAASFVLVLWAGAFYFVTAAWRLGAPVEPPDLGEVATLLFGAASVALFVFSILVGGVAIFGWQALKNAVRVEVEEATHARIDVLEKELRGRVLTIIGFMIGELHSSPDQLDQTVHKDYLSEAVWYCKKGYDILKSVEVKGKNMALNNLVYYSCLYGEELKCDQLLKQARVLKEVGQDYDYAACLLTYCRVVLQCSSDIAEIKDAHTTAARVLRMQLTERQKKEATFYVASLAAKIAEASSPMKEY